MTYTQPNYYVGGYLRCTCHDQCPYHPKYQTIFTTSLTYVPKHRKPGPAQ